MEIDTGASKTILNEATYGRLRDALGPLQTTKAALRTYTGERIPVLGAVMVTVEYEGKKKNLNALIVAGKNRPNLLGRDWLEQIRLDWSTIFHMHMASEIKPHRHFKAYLLNTPMYSWRDWAP